MSAKFMTKTKSDQLVAKLTALVGTNKARELKRNLTVDGRYKMENEQILMTIDAINDAINQKRKIKFQKIEYNVKKERVLHHGGETYTFSPYSLVWDGDFYYVVGFSDKYQSIGSHRVDRIYLRPEILDEAAVPAPLGFDVNKYINTTFRMYNAPRREVELVCDNGVMDAYAGMITYDDIAHGIIDTTVGLHYAMPAQRETAVGRCVHPDAMVDL